MVNDIAVQDFVNAIKDEPTETNTTYNATVSRVDREGVVWVNIHGSKKETPTASTSSEVKRGDEVNVNWRNNKLYIDGNYSNPSAGISRVEKAEEDAVRAHNAAEHAEMEAARAHDAADRAETSANEAKVSAENASEYASRSLASLSTVQSVSETLTWITQHGTMTLTSDTELDPTHVYFVVDANGDYVVGSTHYSLVTEPNADDLSTYYELSIDESLNNYVGTHLALTGEGLWLLPATSGTNKVLIATGAGTTYTTAGTYIINSTGGVEASFRTNGATIGQVLNGYSRTEIGTNGMQIVQRESGSDTQIAHLGYGLGNAETGTAIAPYYTLGVRDANGAIGNYSTVEGLDNTASAYISHAEGWGTKATGEFSHAEGSHSKATGIISHAEGYKTIASHLYTHAEGATTEATDTYAHAEGDGTKATGSASHSEGSYTIASNTNAHAEGNYTVAQGRHSHTNGSYTVATETDQTVIGHYNKATRSGSEYPYTYSDVGNYAFIVGNGYADTTAGRSNALTVDWNGNVDIASGAKYKINGTALSASDVGAVATSSVTTDGEAGKIPQIKSSGVLELRKYIDMHDTNSTYDYDVRIAVTQGTAAGKGTINFGCDTFNIHGSTLADFVVEQGTSGIWTYRKWFSGIAECWGTTASASRAMTSPYAGWYYANVPAVSLPSGLFTSVTYANGQRSGGTQSSGLVSVSVYAVSTTEISSYIYTGQSSTIDVAVSYEVRGRWK